MDFILSLLPLGLQILAGRLIAKDKNDTGADDDIGQVLIDISPLVPDLVRGRTPNDNAIDRTFLALYRTAESYLRRRGKLPELESFSQITKA